VAAPGARTARDYSLPSSPERLFKSGAILT
jgi:hypothetical protein